MWSDYISPSIQYMRRNPRRSLAAATALAAAAALGGGMYAGYIPSPSFLQGAGNYYNASPSLSLPSALGSYPMSTQMVPYNYGQNALSAVNNAAPWLSRSSRFVGQLPYHLGNYMSTMAGQYSPINLRNAALLMGTGALAHRLRSHMRGNNKNISKSNARAMRLIDQSMGRIPSPRRRR
jgi:hypothetical protein